MKKKYFVEVNKTVQAWTSRMIQTASLAILSDPWSSRAISTNSRAIFWRYSYVHAHSVDFLSVFGVFSAFWESPLIHSPSYRHLGWFSAFLRVLSVASAPASAITTSSISCWLNNIRTRSSQIKHVLLEGSYIEEVRSNSHYRTRSMIIRIDHTCVSSESHIQTSSFRMDELDSSLWA